MSFRFPFPTLKNLSMLRIGHAVLEKETKPLLNRYRNYYESDGDEEFDGDDYENRFAQNLVPSLVHIRELRHDLADVINGMLQQIVSIVSEHAWTSTKAEDVTLIFDVHGRLDVAASWRCYFEDQLNNAESVDPVLELLDDAIRMRTWCEIGAIIAKIMSLVGLDPHSLPKPKLIRNDDDDEYVLAYRMGGLLFEPSSANVVSQLREILRKRRICISRNGDCFHVHISMLCNEYVFMREFFITMDKSEKQSFIEQIIQRLRNCNLEFASEMILDLDDVMLRHLMIKTSEGQCPGSVEFVQWTLHKMLMFWPFTQFFMPMLELLAPFLHTAVYADILRDIPRKVPDQCSFGILYSNILLRFCQAIPLNVKRELVVVYEIFKTKPLESLRHENSKLHDRILKILSPQVE